MNVGEQKILLMAIKSVLYNLCKYSKDDNDYGSDALKIKILQTEAMEGCLIVEEIINKWYEDNGIDTSLPPTDDEIKAANEIIREGFERFKAEHDGSMGNHKIN